MPLGSPWSCLIRSSIFSPIFDNLEIRKNVELSVYYGNDAGMRPYFDPGFGLVNQWDVDLVSGYRHMFLTHGGKSFVRALFASYARLLRYLRSVDVVIIHGYVSMATSPLRLSPRSWSRGHFANLFSCGPIPLLEQFGGDGVLETGGRDSCAAHQRAP